MKHGELMPEEENTLDRIENIVSEILRALHGEPMYKQVGLLDQFEAFKMDVNVKILELSTRVATLEQGNKKWVYGLMCFGIGMIVTISIVFGLSLKEIKSFIKP